VSDIRLVFIRYSTNRIRFDLNIQMNYSDHYDYIDENTQKYIVIFYTPNIEKREFL